MQINITRENDTLTVAPEGFLDTMNAPEFSQAVMDKLTDVKELVIDFGKVEYISSAGLRVLIKLKGIMAGKGTMRLTRVNEIVMEVLEVTGLSGIFNIE